RTRQAMSDASQRLDEVIGAYLQAVEAGTPPDRDQLLTRYPELAGALRTFFDNHDRLMRVGAPLRDASGPTPGEMPTQARGDRADEEGAGTVCYLGEYELLEEIGRGGMGAVFKGRDTELGRELAVKVLLEEHRGRPEFVRRFLEEAQIAGQLQ